MGVRISDMDRFSGLMDDADLMEMTRYSEQKSYSISAQMMAEYFKSQNNGGFKGAITDKSLNDFTYADVGVYWWSGDPGVVGMPQRGLLEVFGSIKPSTTNVQETKIVQRLTYGDEVYVRMSSDGLGGGWSSWGVLKNANGAIMFSGTSTEAEVKFTDVLGGTTSPFAGKSSVPRIILTPCYSDGAVNVINLQEASATGFKVVRFRSSLVAVVENTTADETVTQGAGGTSTTHKVTTNEVTRGAWEEGTFAYNWIAILDG